jgi:hypothetical protein
MSDMKRWPIGGNYAMARKTLRQAIKSLARNLDDPRFDDWDDEMILHVIGEIVTEYRAKRDEHTFKIHGAQVMDTDAINNLMDKISGRPKED